MSKEDVRKALVAMDDDEVRGHLGNGDFSDVADLELDDHERQLLRDAADEYPEVAGFAFDAYLRVGGVTDKWTPLAPAVQNIVDYCTPHKHIAGVKYEDV